MFKSYFVVALRNAIRHSLYASINVFSLAIGIATCIVIYIFISDERSFDQFHSKKNEIYRIANVPNYSTTTQKVAITSGWMSPELPKDFPEVASSTRYWTRGQAAFQENEKQFIVKTTAAVDSTFLDIFDFPLLAGDPNTALDQPNSVLLTEETSLKFFDNYLDAPGRSISVEGKEFTITGVLKNIPENSHLRFDALFSISTYSRTDRMFQTSWDGSFLNTYVLLHPQADPSKLEGEFPQFIARHTGVTDKSKTSTLLLQSLNDIHLNSTDIEYDYNNHRKFNGTYLNVFSIAGVFILILASVNFMNLTVARSSSRKREIGVRKSIGARKTQVAIQFIFESTMTAMVALVLAISLDSLFISSISDAMGRPLMLFSLFQDPLVLVIIIGATGALGFITGIYPSISLSGLKTSVIIKPLATSEGRSFFSNGMVIVQFVIAIAMIEGALIVTRQISFMNESDTGFEKEQIVLLNMNGEVNQKFETLKTELLRSGNVVGVTASGQRLGNNFNSWGFKVKTDSGVFPVLPSNLNVDYDYLEVYGIQLQQGRTFSKKYATDKGRAFIINETMARELHLEDPIGTAAGHAWNEDDSLGSVIGVAKDFNYNSMHFRINALAMVCHPEWGYDEISVKIDGAHAKEALEDIRAAWDKTIDSYPFNYTFLSDHFAELYRTDTQMSSVIGMMTVLAIIISSIGLFGLVLITTQKKVKEIGIRKVLGATELQITGLLSKMFVRLIVVAFVIASPFAYYVMSDWLNNFAYRITNDLVWYVAGGGIAVVITLLTMGYHIVKFAKENPVNSLRSE